MDNLCWTQLAKDDTSELLKKFKAQLNNDDPIITAEAIFSAILDKENDISFSQYLKRFIFEKRNKNNIIKSFDAPDDDYVDYCVELFRNSNIADKPSLFTNDKISIHSDLIKKQLRNWLGGTTPSRENAFLFAFALEMNLEELSEMLKKWLKDKDINYKSYSEVIVWWCIKNKQDYDYAVKLLTKYRRIRKEAYIPIKHNYTEEYKSILYRITSLEELYIFFSALKHNEDDVAQNASVQDCFNELITFVNKNSVYDKNALLMTNGDGADTDKISVSAIEQYIYGYDYIEDKEGKCVKKNTNIPYSNNNIPSTKLNKLHNYKWFVSTLLRRSDLEKMLKGKKSICREDILTLAFFYSVLDEDTDADAESRMLSIGDHLSRCRFEYFNLSHMYDSFICLCLNSSDPFETFRQVWWLSWKSNGNETILK